MLQLLIGILSRLAPQAVKTYAERLSIALGRKVPSTIKPLLEWIKENPIKTEIALATVYQVGDHTVRTIIEDNESVISSKLVSAVISSEGSKAKLKYRTSQTALKDVNRIVGDGNPSTIHGVSLQQYNSQRATGRETDRLIKQAVAIVGSKTNLMILRDALLSVEPEELNSYRT